MTTIFNVDITRSVMNRELDEVVRMSMFVITESLPQKNPEPAAPCAAPPARASWYVQGKVVLDFILALTLLILTGPLMFCAMLLVKLTSRGPAIYSQTRLGRH